VYARSVLEEPVHVKLKLNLCWKEAVMNAG